MALAGRPWLAADRGRRLAGELARIAIAIGTSQPEPSRRDRQCLSETSPVASFNHPGRERKPGSRQ